MARHDHQNHATGHDPDRRGLDRQVPEVSRCQEGPETIYERAVEVKADPDQRESTDHPDQARVEFGRAHEAADQAFMLSGRF